MDRRKPDPLHQETAQLVRELHEFEYQELHPDIQHILDALCGPVDPLSGTREIELGINGKIDRIEHRTATLDKKVTELHQNGKVRFSTAFKVVGGATVTGIFTILYLILEHVLGG